MRQVVTIVREETVVGGQARISVGVPPEVGVLQGARLCAEAAAILVGQVQNVIDQQAAIAAAQAEGTRPPA